jgi:hypothetical protein
MPNVDGPEDARECALPLVRKGASVLRSPVLHLKVAVHPVTTCGVRVEHAPHIQHVGKSQVANENHQGVGQTQEGGFEGANTSSTSAVIMRGSNLVGASRLYNSLVGSGSSHFGDYKTWDNVEFSAINNDSASEDEEAVVPTAPARTVQETRLRDRFSAPGRTSRAKSLMILTQQQYEQPTTSPKKRRFPESARVDAQENLNQDAAKTSDLFSAMDSAVREVEAHDANEGQREEANARNATQKRSPSLKRPSIFSSNVSEGRNFVERSRGVDVSPTGVDADEVKFRLDFMEASSAGEQEERRASGETMAERMESTGGDSDSSRRSDERVKELHAKSSFSRGWSWGFRNTKRQKKGPALEEPLPSRTERKVSSLDLDSVCGSSGSLKKVSHTRSSSWMSGGLKGLYSAVMEGYWGSPSRLKSTKSTSDIAGVSFKSEMPGSDTTLEPPSKANDTVQNPSPAGDDDRPATEEEENAHLARALALSKDVSEGGSRFCTTITRVRPDGSMDWRPLATGPFTGSTSRTSRTSRTSSSTPIEEWGEHEEEEAEISTGSWQTVALHNRTPPRVNVPAEVFFTAVDQRAVGGSAACSVLAVAIAEWLLQHPGQLPTGGAGAEFEKMIRDGVEEWNVLCERDDLKKRFPDLHFDLETAFKTKRRDENLQPLVKLETCLLNSYVGFFQPKGLEKGDCPMLECLLDGVMPLAQIWDELARASGPAVFLISWNDHFFVLKIERGACYLIETLGERLHEGCTRAYMLHFDDRDGAGGIKTLSRYLTEVVAELPLAQLVADIKQDLKQTKEDQPSRIDPMTCLRALQIEFQLVKQV